MYIHDEFDQSKESSTQPSCFQILPIGCLPQLETTRGLNRLAKTVTIRLFPPIPVSVPTRLLTPIPTLICRVVHLGTSLLGKTKTCCTADPYRRAGRVFQNRQVPEPD